MRTPTARREDGGAVRPHAVIAAIALLTAVFLALLSGSWVAWAAAVAAAVWVVWAAADHAMRQVLDRPVHLGHARPEDR